MPGTSSDGEHRGMVGSGIRGKRHGSSQTEWIGAGRVFAVASRRRVRNRAYMGLRHGVGWYLSNSASPITQQMGQSFSNGALAPLAWMALAICWLGALLSYLASRKRARLLETQTGLDSLRAMSWREFEMLVGEAFRRQGYSVEETGLGGADGGVDLILRKDGRTELVQCKQWRRQQINVSVVREMWGLVHHHRADAVKIVAVGEFTRDAMAFAQGKAIEIAETHISRTSLTQAFERDGEVAVTEAIKDANFDVYIDFVKGHGGASRVFHSMGQLVDAFAQLDQVLAGIISEASRTEIVLDDVEGGSIRSRLRSILQDIPDDALKDGEWKKILGHFLVRGKYLVCEWLRENPQITKLEQIQVLQDQLAIEAENTGVRFLPMYRPVDTRTLLGVIAEIDRSISPLDPRDVVRYESTYGKVTIPHTQHVHDDLIRDLLTREILTADDERIVKVKKPDFLGRSQWLLKYAGHTISANIDDIQWLVAFQSGQIDVKPGDSLRVVMHEEVYYGHNMEVIHVTHSVVEILDVLRPSLPKQSGFRF
jgi:hypothetical protein